MSFIHWRNRVAYYYWTDVSGVKHGKSLDTRDPLEAEERKVKEDRRRRNGGQSVNEDMDWEGFRKEFLEGYKEGSGTWQIYCDTFRMIKQIINPGRPVDITYKKGREFVNALLKHKSPKTKRPLMGNTINIYIRNLKTMMREAKRLKYVAENPLEELKQVPVTKAVPRYFTFEQIKALKDETRKSASKDLYLICLFFLYTGIRLDELINLKWSSVDLERELFFLHGAETWEPKDREEHAIGLHDELLKALKRRESREGYIFPGKAGKRNKEALIRRFNRVYERAGINARGLHVIRHTFATHFPGDSRTLQSILGHSDLKTTERYKHVTRENMMAVKEIDYRA